MRFYIGWHQPSDAHRFPRCMISINRLRTRRKPLGCADVMIDGAGFTEVTTHGGYREPPRVYAGHLRRVRDLCGVTAGVAQDLMCEPFALAKTGLTVADHQRITIERYDDLMAADPGVYVLPVLQGYAPHEYAAHVDQYGARLTLGQWVGVGSVCKRNADPGAIEAVLLAIHAVRPDLRLHGFGLKLTALASDVVRSRLATADSMASSYNARKNGRNANDWRIAAEYAERVAAWDAPSQPSLFAREIAA